MCGIAGIVSQRLATSDGLHAVAEEMLRRLRHRGPDGSGVHVHGPAALGAARLAVIDTREIPQPLVSRDGRHVIAYNGEAYNYRDVRRDLSARGVKFATDTDTEVVVEAYKAWGKQALSRFHGMFAFVILDRETGELFGARDRMGKKPFFYHHAPGLFAFASFLPSFGAVPGLHLTLDARALFDVVELGYTLCPKSAYTEVRQLPPAHAFTLQDGQLKIFQYWSLAEQFMAGSALRWSEQYEMRGKLAEALRRAVKMRLIADVELGVLLSGGLDSSIIAALMNELSTERVKSFSVGFEEEGFDERPAALAVARHLRTDHHAEVMKLDVPQRLARVQWYVGEPLADTSVLPSFLVSEIARKRVTVALTGDGADELFAGYETFRADRALSLLRWAKPLVRAAASFFPVDHGKVTLAYKVHKFAEGMDLPAVDAHSFWRALMSHADARRCFLPDAREELGEYTPVERFRELDAEVQGCDLVNRFSYVDLRTYLLDDILVKVDRATMGHSLEGRNPYLDHAVVEAAARLPGRWKLHLTTGKWLLRKQHVHRLPGRTLRRTKEGFSSPVAQWLLGSLREPFFDLVTTRRMNALGIDYVETQRLYREMEQRRGFHGYKLWALFVIALWDSVRTSADAP